MAEGATTLIKSIIQFPIDFAANSLDASTVYGLIVFFVIVSTVLVVFLPFLNFFFLKLLKRSFRIK